MDDEPGLFTSNQTPSVQITPAGPQTPSIEITPTATPESNPADYAGFVSPTLNGSTLRDYASNEWWKRDTEMAGGPTVEIPTMSDAGGSIFDQHEGTGVMPSVASSGGPSPSPFSDPAEDWTGADPPIDEPFVEPPPIAGSDAPSLLPPPEGSEDWRYVDKDVTLPEDEIAPDLLAERQGPPSAAFYSLGRTPVASTNFMPGMDQSQRPMPNLLSFGLVPGGNLGRTAGGEVRYANARTYAAGDPLNDIPESIPSSEAEAVGARETAALRASGELPPSTERPQDRVSQGVRDPWTGYMPGASGPGYGTNPRQLADLQLMAMVAQHDNVNDMGTTSDEGQNRFFNGVFRLTDEGTFERVGERTIGYRRPTQRLIAGRTVNGAPWASATAPRGGGG
jgi:hypothetical protein